MKHAFASILMLLTAATVWSCTPPPPERFTLSSRTEAVCAGDTLLAPLAGYLAAHFSKRTTSDNRWDVIRLQRDTLLDTEEYRVEVAPTGCTIRGGSYGGVFNGVQAFFGLLPAEIYARRCPATPLRDTVLQSKPRFPYRSMMLDVARTWYSPEQLHRRIELLAYHRINKLHLHLTDDEGWRIEIGSHPELTRIGSLRGGDSPIRPVYGRWHEQYGGHYTREQLRALIRHAAERNIEIIPEIDLPGHSRAIAAVHPEIRCPYRPDTISSRGYDTRSAWCVAREENYALLEDILEEVCTLFPSPYVHIGGDEVDVEQWTRCPDCRALMQREGMQAPEELEAFFLNRVIGMLERHGKRAAVWNEAAASGRLPRRTLVFGWKDTEACLQAAQNGYPTVVMPGKHFYLDMRQSPHEAGHDWAGIVDARRLYSFDFGREGFSEQQMQHIMGFEGAFWSEAGLTHEPETDDYLDYMCFPRLTALAHMGWYGTGDWEEFYTQLVSVHYDRLTAMGAGFRLFPPRITYRDGLLSAATDDSSQLFYVRRDERTEHPYTAPIATEYPARYRFISRRGTGHSPLTAHEEYHRRIRPEVTVTSSMGESSRFPYANAAGYRGISRTRRTARKGDWICYTFTRNVSAREILVRTGNPQLPKSLFTRGVVEISENGTDYRRAGELDHGVFILHEPRNVKSIRITSASDITDGTPFITIEPLEISPVERPMK